MAKFLIENVDGTTFVYREDPDGFLHEDFRLDAGEASYINIETSITITSVKKEGK